MLVVVTAAAVCLFAFYLYVMGVGVTCLSKGPLFTSTAIATEFMLQFATINANIRKYKQLKSDYGNDICQ